VLPLTNVKADKFHVKAERRGKGIFLDGTPKSRSEWLLATTSVMMINRIIILTYNLDFDTSAYSPICRDFLQLEDTTFFDTIAGGNLGLARKRPWAGFPCQGRSAAGPRNPRCALIPAIDAPGEGNINKYHESSDKRR